MRKWSSALAALAVLGTPAVAQVRPQDCRAVFPLTDPVAQVLPQDVFAEQAVPAVAAKRGFIGLPFLLPLLLAGGGALLIDDNGNGNGNIDVSPA
jgi:hypothetical protein